MKNLKISAPFIIALIIVLFIIFILPTLVNPRQDASLPSCANNLKQIWDASKLYREENNNKWPTQLSDLIPTYLDNPKVINCPPSNVQYTYVQPSQEAPSSTVIITCTQHVKQKQAVTLYKGGYIKYERMHK